MNKKPILPKPENLRSLTNEAIERGRQEMLKKQQLEEEKKRRKEEKEQLRANQILEGVPLACEKAAADGQSIAIVMELKSEEYTYPTVRPMMLGPTSLKGAALIVWHELVQATLRPELDQWDDGCGVKSGWNIVVHW